MLTLTSYDPAKNFLPIGDVAVSTDEEIIEKVVLARNAQKEWRNIGIERRIELLREVYNALFERKEEIGTIATREMGFPKKQQSDFDLGDGFNYFNWYLDNAKKILTPEVTFESEVELHTVFYEPIGVAAIIQPWNFPFCQWSWSVVPNLVVGNTVVFKHSEECPLTGKLIEEIIQSTNLPKGVFNEVYGGAEVGQSLVEQDINLVCFTGSVKSGQKVYEAASRKFVKAILELGGSAPCIVCEDVDMDEIAPIIYVQRFTNNGQICDGLKRLIVHESRFDELVRAIKDIIEEKKVGDPLLEETEFGPLSAKRQLDLLNEQVEDAVMKGATVITGGKRVENLDGAYYYPTLLTNVTPNMRVWNEEVFGPVLPVMSYKTEEEALSNANDTSFGLGGYIYSRDIERAERIASKLETGMVSINGINYVCPFNPFGGVKSSGFGREHGKFGLHDLTQLKLVVRNK